MEGDGAAALEAAAKGINMAKLFAPQDQSWAYPWELHSLLSAPGWHLQEADTASDTADYDTLDEDEVSITRNRARMCSDAPVLDQTDTCRIDCATGAHTEGGLLVD